jgi:hypothetical protein
MFSYQNFELISHFHIQIFIACPAHMIALYFITLILAALDTCAFFEFLHAERFTKLQT